MDEANGPGSILKVARERQGVGIAEVVSQLRLSEKQVEALERDDYSALPGNVFVRGFIRNYARMLGIDPAPLLESLSLPEPKPDVPKAESIPFPSGQKRTWVHYAIVLVLFAFSVLGYQIYRGGHEAPRPPVPKNPPARPAEPVAPMPVSAPAAESAPVSAPEPVRPAPEAVSQVQPASATGASPEAGPIRLEFSAPAWVEVRDAEGKIVFSRLGQPGAVQQVSGKRPFALTIGNAHQVKLFYQGSPVDLAPYIKVDVAHVALK